MAVNVELLEERLREVEQSSQANELRLVGHEQVCAERYNNIHRSLAGFGRSQRWAAVTLITGMAAILVKLLFFPAGS